MKSWKPLSWVWCLAIAWASISCRTTEESNPKLLRVGSDLDNPPFAWVDDQGLARGRDVEMAQALARRMDVELRWERMEFAKLLEALEIGEIDAVIATLGHTPERAQRVLLSQPYFYTSLRVLVRQGEAEPQSLQDLEERLVSAGVGTTSEKALREKLPGAIAAAPSAKGASSLDRLIAGEVDALIMDGPDALDLVLDGSHDVHLIPEALAREDYVVAVRPDGHGWLKRIDRALRKLRSEGILAELDRSFGLVPDPPPHADATERTTD